MDEDDRSGANPAPSTYLSSTVAPAASSFSFNSLASAAGTSSLTSFGALSTISLASFKPRPVIARTSLMTLIFWSPAAARTMVKLSFSSAAPPESPAGAAAATATGAAAETPHFSSRSVDS